MANQINLNAETDANMIGDDSSPTLTLENSSSGNALKLQNAGGTGVALSVVSAPTTSVFVPAPNQAGHFRSSATTAPVLIIDKTVVGGSTIAPLRLLVSQASGAFIGVGGVFISTASMNLAANQTAFHIPVYHETQGVLGYIAVSKGVA